MFDFVILVQNFGGPPEQILGARSMTNLARL